MTALTGPVAQVCCTLQAEEANSHQVGIQCENLCKVWNRRNRNGSINAKHLLKLDLAFTLPVHKPTRSKECNPLFEVPTIRAELVVLFS